MLFWAAIFLIVGVVSTILIISGAATTLVVAAKATLLISIGLFVYALFREARGGEA